MRTIVHLALAAFLVSSAAADADVMVFRVEGKDPGGNAYTGKVTVTEMPKAGVGEGDSFKVVWETGGTPLTGIGVVENANRKLLSIGYVYEGQPGVAVMVEGDGSAAGVWTVIGLNGLGTETWTPMDAATAEPAAAPAGAITYERAVECAAATSFVVGTLRATPGADQAKIDAYDKANSAWIIKLGEVGKDKKMTERIADIKARQGVIAADPDALAKATPIADDCVATAPPIE